MSETNDHQNTRAPAAPIIEEDDEQEETCDTEIQPVALRLPEEADACAPGSVRLRLIQQQVHFVSTIINDQGDKEQEGVVQAGSAARTFTLQVQVLDADNEPTSAFDRELFKASLVFEHDLSLVPPVDPALGSLGGKCEVRPVKGLITYVLGVLNLGRRFWKAGRRNQRFRIVIEAKNEALLETHPNLKLHTLAFATHSRVLNLVMSRARKRDLEDEKKAKGLQMSSGLHFVEGDPQSKKSKGVHGRPSPVVVPSRVLATPQYSPWPQPQAMVPRHIYPSAPTYSSTGSTTPGSAGYYASYHSPQSVYPPGASPFPPPPAPPAQAGAQAQSAAAAPGHAPGASEQQQQRDDDFRSVVRQHMSLTEKYEALMEKHRLLQEHASDVDWKLQQLRQEHTAQVDRNHHLMKVVSHLEGQLAETSQQLEAARR